MERRNRNRSACYFKILLEDDRHIGYIHDISEQGVRVETPQPIDATVGRTIPVKILPPDHTGLTSLVCTLTLRWCKEEGIHHSFGGVIGGINLAKKRLQYQEYLKYYHHNIKD